MCTIWCASRDSETVINLKRGVRRVVSHPRLNYRLVATHSLAKPPEPLNLEDRTHRGENWKQFKRDWTYEVATKIDKEGGPVRVAHLLNVIGRYGLRHV